THRGTRERCDIGAGSEQTDPNRIGDGVQPDLRHVDAMRAACFSYFDVIPTVGPRQDPRFCHQFREIDLAAARPAAVASPCHYKLVIEEDFYMQFIHDLLLSKRSR